MDSDSKNQFQKLIFSNPFINLKFLKPLMIASNNLNSNNLVQLLDYIYIDFRKAFGKVNHKLLPNKLFSFGFHGNFLNFHFIISNNLIVSSGVHQGSHLEPI